MSIFLLDAIRETDQVDAVEAKLRPALPDLVRSKKLDEIAAQSRGADKSVVVLLVMPAAPGEYFSRVINIVTRYRADLFFILLGGEISAGQYKQLIQFANADWVAHPSQADEILDIVSAQRSRQPVKTAPGKRPLVISFAPSAGGVGNSTLAIETAFQALNRKSAKEGPVCLIDLDFQTSHVCDYLDIAPRLDVGEIVGAPQRLDAQLLEALASRHASGLEVFAAPRDAKRFLDLTVEELSALFDLIVQRYRAIIIDLPLGRRAWTGPVLAASRGVVVTGRNTIPGLRMIAEALAAIRREAPQAATRAAVNGCEFGLLGGLMRADHIARVLGEEKPFLIRQTHLALESVNAGNPISLADPSAKFIKDVAAMADFFFNLKIDVAAASDA